MKAKDLRLGNYVWNNVQNIPVNVDMKILSDCLMFEKGHAQYEWHPVELTEDVLVKLGFEILSYEDAEDYLIVVFVNPKFPKYSVLLIEDGFNELVVNISEDIHFVIHGELRHLHILQNILYDIDNIELNL